MKRFKWITKELIESQDTAEVKEIMNEMEWLKTMCQRDIDLCLTNPTIPDTVKQRNERDIEGCDMVIKMCLIRIKDLTVNTLEKWNQ